MLLCIVFLLVHICAYVYNFVHVFCVCVYMFVHVVCACVCIHVCSVCMCICMYMHLCFSVCLLMTVGVCVCVSIRVCICMCVCLCTHRYDETRKATMIEEKELLGDGRIME